MWKTIANRSSEWGPWCFLKCPVLRCLENAAIYALPLPLNMPHQLRKHMAGVIQAANKSSGANTAFANKQTMLKAPANTCSGFTFVQREKKVKGKRAHQINVTYLGL